MRPITNSEVVCFQTCERLWQHTYIDHRTGFTRPEALDRGTRIHQALATWWQEPGMLTCFGPPNDSASERAMVLGYNAMYKDMSSFRNVRVNVPFIVRLGFVDVVGEFDAIAEDDLGDVVIEHKSTTFDITPDSAWWREKTTCDTQMTVYSAARPGARILVDALHVPDIVPHKSTPEDKRKYTKATKTEPSRLYANQHEADETDEEYIGRVLADMSDTPEKYFQRAFVVRLESDIESLREDVQIVADRMRLGLVSGAARNAKACFNYGRPCAFLDACWNGKSIEDYPQVELNHSEDVVRRLEMYKEIEKHERRV